MSDRGLPAAKPAGGARARTTRFIIIIICNTDNRILSGEGACTHRHRHRHRHMGTGRGRGRGRGRQTEGHRYNEIRPYVCLCDTDIKTYGRMYFCVTQI